MSIQLLNPLQLALVSGKGGVGKTTFACTLARYWAQQFPTEKIRLLSTDPAHSLGDVLQVPVTDTPNPLSELANLEVQALNAESLLQTFKATYGTVLEQLVERGSFVQQADLSPLWDMTWPGLDELMGILEIQRLLRAGVADRIVVDMAPSGHSLNLIRLMDFLDEFLSALELFQEKHRVICQTLAGKYHEDEADAFLRTMKMDLTQGRQMLQDGSRTACLVVAIAEPMSLLETQRFIAALTQLNIAVGAIIINRFFTCNFDSAPERQETLPWEKQDRLYEQQFLLKDFLNLAGSLPVLTIPLQPTEPIGITALDQLVPQIGLAEACVFGMVAPQPAIPAPLPPGFGDFISHGRRLLLVGGKGGVGKTTVAAAIAWGMANRHPNQKIRVISIDPAHSLGDAFGQALGHTPQAIRPNLSGQEIDATLVLDQFRADYLWELAEMMSGESQQGDTQLKMAYAPEAWQRIIDQALPGIDEMLSLLTVMELLETGEQDLIVLDMAPTGHLLRFLEMPAALGDWLAWIFKLWIKYQAVLGRVELMGRLRTLRQRVIQAQKKLTDPAHTEFIGVVQAQAAIVAEAQRLTHALSQRGVTQNYLVHNQYQPGQSLQSQFPQQTITRLPRLPRSVSPLERIEIAASLLF